MNLTERHVLGIRLRDVDHLTYRQISERPEFQNSKTGEPLSRERIRQIILIGRRLQAKKRVVALVAEGKLAPYRTPRTGADLAAVRKERIDTYDFNTRAINAAKNWSLVTIGDLADFPVDKLLHTPNIGVGTVIHIANVLRALGVPTPRRTK